MRWFRHVSCNIVSHRWNPYIKDSEWLCQMGGSSVARQVLGFALSVVVSVCPGTTCRTSDELGCSTGRLLLMRPQWTSQWETERDKLSKLEKHMKHLKGTDCRRRETKMRKASLVKALASGITSISSTVPLRCRTSIFMAEPLPFLHAAAAEPLEDHQGASEPHQAAIKHWPGSWSRNRAVPGPDLQVPVQLFETFQMALAQRRSTKGPDDCSAQCCGKNRSRPDVRQFFHVLTYYAKEDNTQMSNVSQLHIHPHVEAVLATAVYTTPDPATLRPWGLEAGGRVGGTCGTSSASRGRPDHEMPWGCRAQVETLWTSLSLLSEWHIWNRSVLSCLFLLAVLGFMLPTPKVPVYERTVLCKDPLKYIGQERKLTRLQRVSPAKAAIPPQSCFLSGGHPPKAHSQSQACLWHPPAPLRRFRGRCPPVGPWPGQTLPTSARVGPENGGVQPEELDHCPSGQLKSVCTLGSKAALKFQSVWQLKSRKHFACSASASCSWNSPFLHTEKSATYRPSALSLLACSSPTDPSLLRGAFPRAEVLTPCRVARTSVRLNIGRSST